MQLGQGKDSPRGASPQTRITTHNNHLNIPGISHNQPVMT